VSAKSKDLREGGWTRRGVTAVQAGTREPDPGRGPVSLLKGVRKKGRLAEGWSWRGRPDREELVRWTRWANVGTGREDFVDENYSLSERKRLSCS